MLAAPGALRLPLSGRIFPHDLSVAPGTMKGSMLGALLGIVLSERGAPFDDAEVTVL